MERQRTSFGTGRAKEPGECGGLQTSHCAEADALPGITETFYHVTAERRFPNSVVRMLIEHATGGVPAAARAPRSIVPMKFTLMHTDYSIQKICFHGLKTKTILNWKDLIMQMMQENFIKT